MNTKPGGIAFTIQSFDTPRRDLLYTREMTSSAKDRIYS